MDIIEVIWKASDSFGKFIDKLLEAWRRRDHRRVLLLGFVVLFIFCASQQEELKSLNIPIIKDIFIFLEPPWLIIFWVLDFILLMGVIRESIKSLPPPALETTDFKESLAIKGLRSFTEKDREIFKQLQRNRVLQECLAEINRDNFRFGILFGESGSGKTSFIKAGLIPGATRKSWFSRRAIANLTWKPRKRGVS